MVNGLGDAIGVGLLGVIDVQPQMTAVAEEPSELRKIVGRADDEDVPHVGQHQDGQRIVDHRFVVDRDQLL
ncbi:hypothetical protein GCM10009800_48680 [Nocardiopsis rhodophaea]